MASNRDRLAGVIGATAATAMLASVAMWEGDKPVGYRDIKGIPTACEGVTGSIIVGKDYSARCPEMNAGAALAHAQGVLKCTPRITGNQLAAAGSLTYNIGIQGYCGSTVARRFNAGDLRGGCEAMLAWDKARIKGKVVRVRGLTNRRQYERALCLRGL